MERPAPVELYPSRFLVGLFAFMGAAIVTLGVSMAAGLIAGSSSRAERGPDDPLLTGTILCVLGAGFLLWFLPLLLWPRPVVVADADGLHDRSRVWSAGSFAWRDVAALGFVRAGKHSGLGVWLNDPERYIAARPFLVRPILRLRHRFGRPVVHVNVLATRGAIRQYASDVGRAFGVAVRA